MTTSNFFSNSHVSQCSYLSKIIIPRHLEVPRAKSSTQQRAEKMVFWLDLMKKLFSNLGRIWKMLKKDIICLSCFLRGRVHFKRPFFCVCGERCATNARTVLLRTPHLVQYRCFYPTQLCKDHNPNWQQLPLLVKVCREGLVRTRDQTESISPVRGWGWSVLETAGRKHLLLTRSVLCHFYTWMNNCSLKGSFFYA